MIAVYSNGINCGHCITIDRAMTQKVFTDFQKKYKIVWCYMQYNDPGGESGGDAHLWCRGDPVLTRKVQMKIDRIFPYFNFYWKKAGLDVCISGTFLIRGKNPTSVGYEGYAKNLIANIKSKFASAFKKYKYNPNA